ncbi:hypothetical protein ACOSQ4_026306 [Xanthoceras sorbifolium]
MARLSNCFFILLNCILLASGFAAVSLSAHIQFQGGTDCQRALQTPLLVTGLFLIIVPLLGLACWCCKANLMLWVYLVVVFILLLGLVAFTMFALVTTKFSGRRSAYPNNPRPLQVYSHWLKDHFVSGKNWEDIKSCLIHAQVCNNLDNVDIKHWSLIQSGCCKQPTFCELEKRNINGTFMRAAGAAAVEDSDCITWSNKREELCFYCKTCKGGVLANIRRQWRLLSQLNLAVIAVVLLILFAGCCVMKNNRSDHYVRYSAYSNWPNQ